MVAVIVVVVAAAAAAVTATAEEGESEEESELRCEEVRLSVVNVVKVVLELCAAAVPETSSVDMFDRLTA